MTKTGLIVSLDPVTWGPVGFYSTLTRAAALNGVSRQALYAALNEGTVCSGKLWTNETAYDAKALAHGKETIQKHLASEPSLLIA